MRFCFIVVYEFSSVQKMDDKALDRLFTGDLDQLVPLPKRVVRLFISSTFTDMMLERNSLMERVYPKLKKYCRERHGLDFQGVALVVDMRWGVRDEATDDHQTAKLCSREIDNCQRMSLGPNFVALIGDKYGFRPLCNKIKSTEYRALRRCLIELDISTDFLDIWYKEDLNAVPAEYLLQPISSILKNFTNKNEPELQSADQRAWQTIQRRLHKLLMIGSSRLVEQGRMGEQEQLMKYLISVTEREVIEGCLNVKEAKTSCLVYVRSIVDIREQLSRCLVGIAPQQQQLNTTSSTAIQPATAPKAAQDKGPASAGDTKNDASNWRASLQMGEGRINPITTVGNVGGVQNTTRNERRVEKVRRLLAKYIDLSSERAPNEWSLDEEAQKLLGHLRAVKLESKLGGNGTTRASRALCKFKVFWDETEGISLKSEEHKRYLSELTDHFHTNMTKMIRRASKDDQERFKTGLIGEVLQHSHYAKHVSRSFYGRSKELDRIRSYILGPATVGYGVQAATEACELMPMFVYGLSGSGKTSVLARAATLAKEWLDRARNLSVGGGPAKDERWDQRPCIIMRFCCTTPSSSSMVGVLTSVCRQLQYNFYQFGPLNGLMNQETGSANSGRGHNRADGELEAGVGEPQLAYEPIAEDFVRLVFTFRQLVENCRHHYHRGRLFVIILDSVERLTSPVESSIAIKYSWLTSLTKLPPNVRLIVSCNSERGGGVGAQGSEIESVDYVHLKRHFLQLYFPLDSDSSLVRAGIDQAATIEDDSLSNDSSLDINPMDVVPTSKVLERPRESLAGHLLKRLVIPAMRLGRGGFQKPAAVPSAVKASNVGEHSLKRSATSLGLESSATNESAANHSGHILKVPSRPPSLSRGASFKTSRLSSGPAPSIDGSDGKTPKLPRTPRARPPAVNMIHVRPMGVDLALNVVRHWLQELSRTLTQQQWSIVRRSFAHCSRPIFVKLAFGEIVNWKSYSVQSDSKGLTFGSSVLDRGRELKAALSEAANDPSLKLLMDHYEPNWSDAHFKRQILTIEREWLNYLGYNQRKMAPLKQNDGSSKLAGDVHGLIGGGGGPRGSWTDAGALTSNICHLSSTIDEAVSQLFARIELQHGYLLTKHSLSYITAARNGICENELEDILSLDDVVLDDVFQYHLPPVRRIPPLLWTRIRNDLPDYLSERDADGIVLNWHHDQFKLVAQSRYLNDARQIHYIHSNLADYFLGRWADVAKPFRCTKQQILMAAEQLESAIQQSIRDSTSLSSPTQTGTSFTGGRFFEGSGSAASGQSATVSSGGRASRLRSSDQSNRLSNWMQAKADRRVPHQPLHYSPLDSVNLSAKDGASTQQKNSKLVVKGTGLDSQRRRYNLRKITELPYHLMRSGRFLDLANEVLFNYRWLYAAIDATGLQNLLSDFEEGSKGLELALSKRKTSDSRPQSHTESSGSWKREELNAEALKSMISQLNVLNNTIRLASSSIQSDPQMLAPQLIGRLAPLIRAYDGQLEASLESRQLQVGYLIQLLKQCDRDGCSDCALLPTDHCLQAPNGLQLSSLEGHSFAILSMTMAADQRHLLAVSNRFIVWNTATGEVTHDIDPKCEGSIMMELRLGLNDEYVIAYTSNNTILVLDILTQQVVKFHQFESFTSDDKIIGLELVDSFAASRFVVWTNKRWFIMGLAKNELNRSVSTMSHRITIEVENSFALADVEPERYNLGSSLNIQRVHHDANDNISFIELKVNNHELQLLTVAHPVEGCPKLWEQWPEVGSTPAAFCLESRLRQLVISNLGGDVFLVRRRNERWSRPKLIWSWNGLNLDPLEDATKINSVPMAIELISHKTMERPRKLKVHEFQHSDQMAAFERRIDGDQVDELVKMSTPLSVEKENLHQKSKGRDLQQKLAGGSHLRIVLLYLSDRIIVLRMDTKSEKSLLLPRDIRNISIEPNKCQIRAIILGGYGQLADKESFLAAATGRRLLLYSLEKGEFLRSIECAHAARIVQLVPIVSQMSCSNGSLKPDDDRWLSFASASMDKTVKIWNLSNLDKDIHTLDKLDNPIESMSLATQKRPWVACLGRSELGLWDWRTMRLLVKLSQHDLLRREHPRVLAPESDDHHQQQTTSNHPTRVSRLVKCCLSSDGLYLCLASLQWIHLFAIEESSQALEVRHKLNCCAEHKLPDNGLVRGLRFFQQDSRLLTSVECPLSGGVTEDEKTDSSSPTPASGGDSPLAPLDARRLLIFCHSIPDGHLLYTIDSITPTIRHNTTGTATDSHQLIARQAGSERIRLPVLTCDQLHVVSVVVESESGLATDTKRTLPARLARKRSSSGAGKLDSTLLAVYSARDGLLLRRIYLSQLEPYNPRPEQQLGPSGRMDQNQQQQQFNLSAEDSLDRRVCSVGGEQFSRIKSVASYRERQSVVALLDHERSSSFLVDVNTRQLMASSSIWMGKMSTNGRFGLSRMYKPASSLRCPTAGHLATTTTIASTTTTTTTTTSDRGLQLLEMGHCLPVKPLLTHETLAKLSSIRREASGGGATTTTTGNDTEITCGFCGPSDSYVYYHDARLARLLLVRVRDGHLVANYKLSTRVTKIKCSADGYALLLALADGSLTSLAIVDPQMDDTVVRLAQYPSRTRMS